jgi:sigma-54 dependent transcriptional regulator, acetoin dehydrogenase operon transcriptional activator AcoR
MRRDEDAARASSATAVSRGSRGAASMQDWQASLIERTLSQHNGNVSATARELGLARNTVYRYLRLRRMH